MAYKNAIMADDETLVKSFTPRPGAGRDSHRARGERGAGLPAAAGPAAPRASRARPPIRCRGLPKWKRKRPTAPSPSPTCWARPLHRPRLLRRVARRHRPRPRAGPARLRRSAGGPPADRRQRLPERGPRIRPRPRDEPTVSQQAPPGRAVARPARREPAHHGHRPLHLLRRAEGGRQGRLHPHPQRLRRRRGAHGGDLGRRRQHGQIDAVRIRARDLDQRRADFQYLSAQGHRRRGRRRRPGAVGSGRHAAPSPPRPSSPKAASMSSKAAPCAASPP